jgi:hypothetical protein
MDCIHNTDGEGVCDYGGAEDECHSKVAQVNALTLELQKLTGKKVVLK